MLEPLAVEFNILFRFVSGDENEENVDLHPPAPMPSPGLSMRRMGDAGEPSGAKFSGEAPKWGSGPLSNFTTLTRPFRLR